MTTTTIEWTDTVWNPVRGCSMVSVGCEHCYAMKQAHRFGGDGQPYEGLTELGPHGPRWTGTVRLVPELLEAPLHWKQPRRIFVNSMSDLFHEDVSDEFIFQVFDVMRRASWHQFQILTKRPERLRLACTWLRDRHGPDHIRWPLPNVWLGVSVEDEQTADRRIPLLLQTPTAVRWVSAEPLLGEIDLSPYLAGVCSDCAALKRECDAYRKAGKIACCPDCRHHALDWVVVGGESGPGARPCDVAWIRSIVRQCQAAHVPVFVKQIGRKAGIGHQTNYGSGSVIIPLGLKDRKGGDPLEWPTDLRVREWPQ